MLLNWGGGEWGWDGGLVFGVVGISDYRLGLLRFVLQMDDCTPLFQLIVVGLFILWMRVLGPY